VYLVGFTIDIYYESRSYGRQIIVCFTLWVSQLFQIWYIEYLASRTLVSWQLINTLPFVTVMQLILPVQNFLNSTFPTLEAQTWAIFPSSVPETKLFFRTKNIVNVLPVTPEHCYMYKSTTPLGTTAITTTTTTNTTTTTTTNITNIITIVITINNNNNNNNTIITTTVTTITTTILLLLQLLILLLLLLILLLLQYYYSYY